MNERRSSNDSSNPLPSHIVNPQLAEKLVKVRNKAEQPGQFYTNLPRERYADARFDDQPNLVSIPTLNRAQFDVVHNESPRSSGRKESIRLSPKSSKLASVVGERHSVSLQPAIFEVGPHHSDSAFPYAEASLHCSKCYAPGEMKRIYIGDCSSSILSHACSVCNVSFSDSPLIKSISPSCVYPVAHECETCGWRVCVECNITLSIQKKVSLIKKTLEDEIEGKYAAKLDLMDQEMKEMDERLKQFSEGTTTPPPMVLSSYGGGSCSPLSPSSDLLQSMKNRVIDLENKLVAEKRAKEHSAAVLASLQKEYMQFKTDIEMHLESNSAEQILLQSRLVEQSVLLADARARIDELTSIQRRDIGSPNIGSGLSQREAILINENNRLKEEVDLLKVSVHTDFDNWKRTVMKQVKNECIRYRSRLERSQTFSDNTANKLHEEDDDNNEKDLDYLFDQVDWTGNIEAISRDSLQDFIADANNADSIGSPKS